MKRLLCIFIALLLIISSHLSAEASYDEQRFQADVDKRCIETAKEELPTWCEAGYHDGRFLIPKVGIDVGYRFEYVIWDWQWITDLPDTACLFHWYETHDIVADHKFQAFESLIDVEVGDRAYFVTEDKVLTYICIDVFDGHNTEWTLTDAEYNSITQKYDLFCYTCLDWWANIHIVVFEKEA